METNTTIERYGVYYNNIHLLEKSSFQSSPKIKDLKLSRANMQRAYKEMKAEGFKGTLVEYVGWIAIEYGLFQASRQEVSANLAKEVLAIFKGYILKIGVAEFHRWTNSKNFKMLALAWAKAHQNKTEDFKKAFRTALTAVYFMEEDTK